jgi:dUTP pyrophosphatase
MACSDCSCGRKEREIAAAKAKKENSDRIVIYDAEAEESGCGSCPSAKEYDPKTDPANELNSWMVVSGLDVVTVRIKKLDNFFALPEYKTPGAAAMDLYSAEDIFAPITAITVVSTGIALEIPEGYEAQIRARSGLAVNGVMVANSPGTIDEDFRGEIKVILANFGYNTTENAVVPGGPVTLNPSGWQIKKGDRIAQMVFSPVTKAMLKIVEELNETERGSGGFGSTGIR